MCQEKDFIKNINLSDVLLLNGEGTMHHDKVTAMELLKGVELYKSYGKPCILVNSIWQDNIILNKYLHLFDRIFVRDKLSQEQIQQAGYEATVSPDLSFSTPYQKKQLKKTKTVITDSVIPEKRFYLMKLAIKLGSPFWYMQRTFHEKWREKLFYTFFSNQNIQNIESLGDVKLIVSGRFHAICLAIMTQTPFMYLPSNTLKIENMLNDIGVDPGKYNLENYKETVSKNKMYNFINPVFQKDLKKFDDYREKAKKKHQEIFQEIYDLINLYH